MVKTNTLTLGADSREVMLSDSREVMQQTACMSNAILGFLNCNTVPSNFVFGERLGHFQPLKKKFCPVACFLQSTRTI